MTSAGSRSCADLRKTLYGRNFLVGGSINVVTNQPTDTFQASVDATFGNYDNQTFRGFYQRSVGLRATASRLRAA